MSFDSAYHAPVLAEEVLAFLRGRQRVLDCTLGGGGHALALLENDVAAVVGIDRDPDAIDEARSRLREFESTGRFTAIEANYADLDSIDALAGVTLDGILLDLGISSHQIDATDRGFSFRPGAPLDMRMGRGDGVAVDAAALLNSADEGALASRCGRCGSLARSSSAAVRSLSRRATIWSTPFAARSVLGAARRTSLDSFRRFASP